MIRGLLSRLQARADADGENVGIVTFSFAVVGGTGALARHPDLRVKYLIDWEGPSGPQNLVWVPPGHKVAREHPASDTRFWSERTASEFVKRIRCRYLRVQSEIDHVQTLGKNQHAVEMLENARTGDSPWTRCNGNEPNRLYDGAQIDPKWWLPRKPDERGRDLLLLEYVAEMVEMPPLERR